MEASAGIQARESEYLERFVQLGVAGDKLVSVSFPATPDEEATDEGPLLDRVVRYLEGAADGFEDVDVGLTVPSDQRGVLEALRGVGHGEQVSVEKLTAMTAGLDPDAEDDHELVRRALAGNPVPLVIADHRVRDGPSGAPPEVEQRLRSLEGL
ncbi:MAG: methylated-DNA--[protein]-cysteine S-methyltransferase [Halobacteriales archaeon]|nr:methylated-DNA--[protein]-cysteine S-methyltransferase [Halobacteriales archaeon]